MSALADEHKTNNITVYCWSATPTIGGGNTDQYQLSLPDNVKVKFNGVVSPSFNHQNNGTIYLTCKVNGTQKWQLTQSTTTGSDTNVGFGTSYITFTPTTTQKTFDVSAGQIVTLDVRITYYSRTEALPSGTPMVTCYPTYDRQACEYSTAIPEYVCRYSTNGMMLHNETGSGESAVRKFFGFNNTATNNGNEVMLARCGDYGMSLMEKGLMLCRFSGNNVYRYRMNPLVAVYHFAGRTSNGAMTPLPRFAEVGVTLSANRNNSAGDVTISLNGISNTYTPTITPLDGGSNNYVTIKSKSVNSFNIKTPYDCGIEVCIFDYGSY